MTPIIRHALFVGYAVAVALTVFLSSTSDAFAPSHPARQSQQFGIPSIKANRPLFAKGSGGMAQPSVEIGQKTAVKQKVGQKTTSVTTHRVQVDQPKTRREQEFKEHPMYKLMLIGDDAYDQAHTIERLCDIIEDMDEGLAATVFKSSMVAGKAMCGKYPMEHAEMYREQLLRSDPMIFAELEEEDNIDNN